MTTEETPTPFKDKTEVSDGDGAAHAQDRRRMRGDASAQRIIDATIELIAEEGITTVTMQRIAARVGSSNALVVFHFGSKDNLFATVLQYLTDQYAALWDRLVRQPDLTLEQRVLAASDCVAHFVQEHPSWASAWIAFGGDRKMGLVDRRISLPNEVAYVDEVHAMIAEIARSGGYVGVDTRALAEGLNFLVQGAWFWNNINPSDRTFAVLGKTTRMLLYAAFPRNFPTAAA
jgi:AcrR family transcriptional regulator